jgi:hypothetical protein
MNTPIKTASQWNWEYTQICASDPAVHGQLLPNPQNMKFINAIQRDALRWAAEQIILDGNPELALGRIKTEIQLLETTKK